MEYPRRMWALKSNGAERGKSMFIAANAASPTYVIDTDGRFAQVASLASARDAEIIYPPNQKAYFAPEDLMLGIQNAVLEKGAKSVVFDSLTKLYSLHAKLGFARIRSGEADNRAAEMINKAVAMSMARDSSIFGTELYFIWHEHEARDGSGKLEVRDMISDIERERLGTSLNATLLFKRQKHENAFRYGIEVLSARDFGGKPAHVGFTLWDTPGNYWQGVGERIEHAMYVEAPAPAREQNQSSRPAQPLDPFAKMATFKNLTVGAVCDLASNSNEHIESGQNALDLLESYPDPLPADFKLERQSRITQDGAKKFLKFLLDSTGTPAEFEEASF